MKVSISWLKELVDLKVTMAEVIRLLPMRTIGTKEIIKDYIELDMKGYNRADLLSMRGVAYEIAAITDSSVTFKENSITKEILEEKFQGSLVNVVIEDSNLCPVYCVARIEGLKVEESDDAWKKKLLTCGMRPINNVTDITNLAMLEYGQPLHSFDANQVTGEEIIVRTAKGGEKLVTLDGKERKLAQNDLLITDPDKILGLAGVMGGKQSEVTGQTTSILLEAAIFDPQQNRKTASRLFLQSEASKRFQHGLTKIRLFQAFDACIQMYQNLGGKLTVLKIIDVLDKKENYTSSPKQIHLEHQKVNSLIGIEIKPGVIESSLKKLNFQIKPVLSTSLNYSAWEVTPPFWRLDVAIEEDVIEEIARMYGYEKIPSIKLSGNIPNPINQELPELMYNLKTRFVDMGLTEIQTYSYYSLLSLDNLEISRDDLIRIVNPISSETEYLRESLWPNLLEILKRNLGNFNDLAIFEIGKTYHAQKKALPIETYKLSIALINQTDNPIQELYRIFVQVMDNLKIPVSLCNELPRSRADGVSKQVLVTGSGDRATYRLVHGSVLCDNKKRGGYEEKYFHPTRFSYLGCRDKVIGGIAEVHPRFVNKFGIEQRVAVLEIEIKDLLENS